MARNALVSVSVGADDFRIVETIGQSWPRTDLWEVLLVDVDGIVALDHVLDNTRELHDCLDVVFVLLDLRGMY